MPAYTTGYCNLTPGSQLVTFVGSNLNYIAPGSLFRGSGDVNYYTIGTINATQNKLYLTGRYSNSNYEIYRTGEWMKASDGTRMFYVKTDYFPVLPGSAVFRDGTSFETFVDNGDGTLTGSLGGWGTINYDDGTTFLRFWNTVPAGRGIYADHYYYGVVRSSTAFQVLSDYTPHFRWPETAPSDEAWAYIVKKALRMIDTDLYNHAARTFDFQIFDSKTSVYTADGSKAFTIPYIVNGYNLTDAVASVHTKGITGTMDIQLRRRRAGSNADMLGTKITVGDEFFARDGVINTTYDDVLTGDQIYVDVDTKHTTPAKGLSVTLTLQKV
jgi:hypothetical protein